MRPPFSSVDGLGETVAKQIVKERENGKFISVEDFQLCGKVSQTLVEKNCVLCMFLDNMPESSQLSLF
ncbi:MAG: helix-hairpin-helix domain-containing protein [Clostridium sp.]|nr:MAG: helix-hairpin-helix domain-containing protein [Clostridium sp.]